MITTVAAPEAGPSEGRIAVNEAILVEEDSELEEARKADAELEARAQSRLGAILRDKYRLDYVLGYGGAATVYAATHRNSSRVALKLLHPELALEAEVRTRFLREGYVANKVKHPGAVAVIDDDVTEEGWAFLVMELLVGMTAHSLWEAWSFRLTPPLVTAITLQILDVMESAHQNGIVHRDLKPDNVFLTPQGEAKVLDFGIARVQDSGGRRTNVGSVLGTPAFMAPEQAASRSRDIDARTDLWAVGAIGFTLLTGDIVHPAENPGQILIAAATRPARPLGPLAPEVPAGIVAVFDRALAFDRAERWPSAGAMRDALRQAAEQVYGQAPGPSVIGDALVGLVAPLREVAPYDASGSTTGGKGPRTGVTGTISGVHSGISEVTAAPVHTSLIVEEPSSLGRPVMIGVGVAGLLVAIVGIIASLVLLRPAPAAAGSAEVVEPPPSTQATSAPTVTAAPPATGAPEKPPPASSVASAPTAAAPAQHVKASRPSASKPPAHAAACTPPFVIDPATGQKKWKTECL
jgi:serine/threonine-protein kinase